MKKLICKLLLLALCAMMICPALAETEGKTNAQETVEKY